MMTEKQALAKARKLWGKRAIVRTADHYDGGKCYFLGKLANNQIQLLGTGRSWEAAFENASTLKNLLKGL